MAFISEMAEDDETLDICSDYNSSLLQGTVMEHCEIPFCACFALIFFALADVRANKDLLLIQALRILLLKITIFNVLTTAQAVIKW